MGEAPGAVECVEGRPFVGPAGQLLRITLLKGIEHLCFLTNILACRPTEQGGLANRRPSSTESTNCLFRVFQLWDVLQPSVVVLLGRTALNHLVSHLPGYSAAYAEELGIERPGNPLIVHTYHPSYILRSGGLESPNAQTRKALTDYKGIRTHILMAAEETNNATT